MGLLLYKSDEMFSSTELIRKSKMVFDKVVNKEIEKAIILRDGKPTFLLMEFKKYEKIMAEYEKLKKYVDSQKRSSVPKTSIKENVPKVEQKIVQTNQDNSIQNITPEDKSKIKKITQKTNDISEEQEINNALQSIENIDFDDSMKKEAEEKIKRRILEARKERAKVLTNEHQNKEDLKEELILQGQLKEAKLKKDRELQEFWD